MAIELYFSNRLEELAGKLSDLLYPEIREGLDVLEAPVVIVPNANLIKWLRIELARRQSIFMHTDFKFLETGLWDMLSDLDPIDKPPAMIDGDLLKILLLSVLRGLDPGDEELSPMVRYLSPDGAAGGPDYAARLWQLTEKLAALFQDYERHRTEMLKGWTDPDAAPASGMERCQRRIYLEMKALRDDLARETGDRLLFLTEYSDEVMSKIQPLPARGARRKRIHLFGLSQVSALHLDILYRPRRFYDLYIYAFNPSREFWEDVRTPGELKWIKKRNHRKLQIQASEIEEGELFARKDNALLSAWGKPGRESVRLLCGLTEHDYNACFSDRWCEGSVLNQVQENILTFADETDPVERLPQDRSLQIAACPSAYREVETVYNSILFNLREDERLLLTDIAILVPDMPTYKPVFDSVFNRHPGKIVYNLVDSRADIESIYGQAVLGLLALACGRFSRKAVFEIFLNPCFMARWDVGGDDVRAWADWTEDLGVFHTFRRTDGSDPGAPASGLYTWKQGLQRLRLSRILSIGSPDESGRPRHFMGLSPHADFMAGDADLLQSFCRAVEALHEAVTTLNTPRGAAAEWRDAFLRVTDHLFDIPPTLKGEAGVRQSLLKALDQLKLYDRLRGDESAPPLDPPLVREFIQANLRSISGGYGSYLTGGVTISALLPMRPIPFKIVYVLGMSEGAFPGKADMSSLDLRKIRRRIGDISPPERDRYLFLEMLLSVRSKLYISHVARDLQKDREVQPCGVVNQLKRHVERTILPPGEEFHIATIPLSGDDARYLDPREDAEWSDVMVNYSLSDRVACLRRRGLWEGVRDRIPGSDLSRIERLTPDFSIEAPNADGDEAGIERIHLTALKKFLEDPIGRGVQRRLALDDVDADAIEGLVMREDEPFFTEFPFDYRLGTAPLGQWVDATLARHGTPPPGPGEIHDFLYDDFHRRSRTPEGAFAHADKEASRELVVKSAGILAPLLEEMEAAPDLYADVRVGEFIGERVHSDASLATMQFPPLSLTVKTVNRFEEPVVRSVELHGRLSRAWKSADGSLHALVLTGSGKHARVPDKYSLEPVLFYLTCLAGRESARWIGDAGLTVHALYKEKLTRWFWKCDRDEAGERLSALVSDYLNQRDRAWLPFKTVAGLVGHLKPWDNPVDDEARHSFRTALVEAYSEEDAPSLARLIKPEIPEDALDRARARFRIFLDAKGDDGAKKRKKGKPKK